jgi:hypothetical protein
VRHVDRGRAVGRGQPPGGDDHVGGALGEPGQGRAGSDDEALLRRLLGDAHRGTDLAPRRARVPGLVHEVADQRVGLLVELVGHLEGVRHVL